MSSSSLTINVDIQAQKQQKRMRKTLVMLKEELKSTLKLGGKRTWLEPLFFLVI
jgi:hypothetical protein